MMAVDNQSFSIVRDIGFKRVVNVLEPRYSLPSRKYFSDNIIPTIYNMVEKKVVKMIKESTNISFTTDIWTADESNEPFLSLTAHWIDNYYKQVSLVLSAKHFPGVHNAPAITDAFLSMLGKWEINKDKVHIVIHDNAANISKGIEDTGLAHLPCFIHTLQLSIKDCVFSQRNVSDILALSRKIVSHFKHSPLACSKLKEIQKELGLPDHKLIQDVSVRWNSTYYMLQRLYKQRRAVGVYASDNDIPCLTVHQWEIVDKVLFLLEPMEDLTRQASQASATLSMVIPSVYTLIHYLGKHSDDSGVKAMKASMKESVERRFEDVENNPFYVVSCTLDPRFKMSCFKEPLKVQAKLWIMEEINKTQSSDLLDPNIASEVGSNAVLPKKRRTDGSGGFWDCFEEVVSGTTIRNNEGSGHESNYVKNELEEYLLLNTVISRTADPLQWWEKHANVLPKLEKLAK